LHENHTRWTTLLLTAALAGAVPLSEPAPLGAQAVTTTSASLPLFGKVDLTYSTSGDFNTTTGYGRAIGRVTMTSEDYDLSCETLTFRSEKPRAGGRPLLAKVTADPAAGGQVTADVRRPDALNPSNGQTFHIVADHAAYVPDRSRPNGVKIDFTGHVKVTTTSGFLSGPSVTTTDRATILLGQGDDYPSVSTGPAHLTATPAQQ